MKRNRLTVLFALLLVVVMSVGVFLVGCKDDVETEKKAGFISAVPEQTFIYDGQQHDVKASLNHTEAELTYSPAKGYTEIGEYEITISAPETENYKAVSTKVILRIEEAPAPTMSQLWGDLLDEVIDTFSLAGKDKVRLSLNAEGNVKTGGKTTKLGVDVTGNVDFSDTVNNATLFHAVIGVGEQSFGLYYQDGAMYLAVGEQLFAINNSNLASILSSVSDKLPEINADEKILAIVKTILPGVLFRENDIQRSDGGVYSVTLSLNHIWSVLDSEFGRGLIGNMISEENLEIFGKFFAENEISFDFTIDLTQSGSATAGVEVEGGSASLKAFEIADGFYDSVSGKLSQEAIDGAIDINLANVEVNGTFELIDRTGKTYEHLSYKLVADIDPFALITAITINPKGWMNDEAVKQMKLYFSVYHEHTPGADGVVCTDVMCPTRVGGQADTSILDVAFDPQNFGTSKIYVAANLSRLFSDKSFETTVTQVVSLASMLMNQISEVKTYSIFTSLDLEILLNADSSEDPDDPTDPEEEFQFDVNTMLDPLVSLITKCITIDENGLALDVEQTYDFLNQVFNLDALIDVNLENLIKINTANIRDGIIKGLLSPDDAADTDAQFNTLRFNAPTVEFGVASDFNCKEAILNLPTDANVARTFNNSKPLALENADPKATGKVFNTKQNIVDFTAEDGIHILANDLDKIIGKNIEYTYTAMDGKTYTAVTQLVAINGLDTTLLNQEQTVIGYVLPMDGQGGLLSDGLFNVLKNIYKAPLVGGFLPAHIALPIRADAIELKLTIAEVDSAEFAVDKEVPETFELTPYEYDSTAKLDLSKEYMGAQITLTLTDGTVQTVGASVDTNLVDGKYLVNDGNEYYIEFYYDKAPEFNKRYTFRAVNPEMPSLIVNSDGSVKVAAYGATENLSIEVVARKGSLNTSAILDASDYELKIKGKTLSEINLATEGQELINLIDSVDDIQMNFKKDIAKISSVYLHFNLVYADGTKSETKKYGISFRKYNNGEEVWSSSFSIDKLGSQIDGAYNVYYWAEDDGDFAPVRTLTLKFEDGKYYMVDDLNNPTVKREAKVTVYDKNDSTKTDILENGVISYDKWLKVSAGAVNNNASPSVNFEIEYTIVDGGNTIKNTKAITLAKTLNFTYVKYNGKIASETRFNDLVKFEVVDTNGEKHDMRLVWKNGKYYLSDTFDGEKLADIEVTVKANIVISSSAIGDAFDLVDGKISADMIGKKITLTFEFSYGGYDFSAAKIINNKTVE